ncbi:CRISPR-associated helicase/endonuclease Cas3 [Methylobacillus flagellatus]|uniref:CRISPR-associated helicase, Cas3 family n=1 Tax=Methylobacillus flagellatus (strain ATCC 51484 / DSM 6875 / VKM B-1610 / KT) TaxID=265072 RepID=Q1H3R6_METFK|nr:CRISPR-associated helicase/endonuclease Cas3 [Methylobacillus flagellatus]ABE48871.1 CRISPR-associated helicase, Cas3 family [Methylobacillus flagellatus KT]
MAYFAHSGIAEDLSDGQRLADHLHAVAKLARESATWFGWQDWAYIAGLLHDLGKYCPEFQARLHGSLKRVDHATAGAKQSVERWGKSGKLLAYCIAGHHTGLANGREGGQDRYALDKRLSTEYGKQLPVLDPVWQEELSLPEHLPMAEFIWHQSPAQAGLQLALLTRMIFSCLIDADRTDTRRHYDKLDGKQVTTHSLPTLEQLREALDATLDCFKAVPAPEGSVNQLRQEILGHARSQALQKPGLFSLTVPTGGGKTYTSMAFALDHAIAHGMRRVIYVIPFTSIIEQNAKVLREAFGPLGDDAVLEHHSAFDASKLPTQTARDHLKQAMESWNKPVVVTTAVQFFESLFSDRPSQCRKLHNIAGSVVILDEAQVLPLKLLRPIMAVIDELARNYKCSVVLCTATQPALKKDQGFINGFDGVREIVPVPEALFKKFKRTEVKSIGLQQDEDLVRHLTEREQVLMIVNNRRHARALYDAVAHLPEAMHLTTLMCARHRSQVLARVRLNLRDGKPCRLISTSLIEAGVDVDFPCVMRAEAGLDSIAQAAGRCNREGRRSPEQSEVLVFQSPEWKAPPELDQLAGNMREVMRNHAGDLLAPEALTMYFKGVYWAQGAELDSKRLLEIHREHARDFSFPFQDIARDFCMIEAHMKPVIVPFDDEARELIDALPHAEHIGGIARKLQQYLVQVPEKSFAELVKSGSVQAIAPEVLGDQFWRLVNESLYDAEAGLSFDNPFYIKAENLAI